MFIDSRDSDRCTGELTNGCGLPLLCVFCWFGLHPQTCLALVILVSVSHFYYLHFSPPACLPQTTPSYRISTSFWPSYSLVSDQKSAPDHRLVPRWNYLHIISRRAAQMIGDMHPRLEQLIRLGLPFLVGMIFFIWRHHIPLSWSVLAGLVFLTALAWFTPLFPPIFAVALSYAIFVLGYANTPILHSYNRLGDYSYGTYIYAFPNSAACRTGRCHITYCEHGDCSSVYRSLRCHLLAYD